jgi:hypothetical protein
VILFFVFVVLVSSLIFLQNHPPEHGKYGPYHGRPLGQSGVWSGVLGVDRFGQPPESQLGSVGKKKRKKMVRRFFSFSTALALAPCANANIHISTHAPLHRPMSPSAIKNKKQKRKTKKN